MVWWGPFANREAVSIAGSGQGFNEQGGIWPCRGKQFTRDGSGPPAVPVFLSELRITCLAERDCPRPQLEPLPGAGRQEVRFFFTPLSARWLTYMVRRMDFSPKGTDLRSRILNLEFLESSASSPFPAGRRPLLVSPGIAALLCQPQPSAWHKYERERPGACGSERGRWIPKREGYVGGLA